jgi:hypothetical protein
MKNGMRIRVMYSFLCIRESSAFKRVPFVSERMSYIILIGGWCHIIVLNIHAQTQDKIDDVKDNFYEELECMFNRFPKYHTKILLGDFSAKVGKEDILNQQSEMKYTWMFPDGKTNPQSN